MSVFIQATNTQRYGVFFFAETKTLEVVRRGCICPNCNGHDYVEEKITRDKRCMISLPTREACLEYCDKLNLVVMPSMESMK